MRILRDFLLLVAILTATFAFSSQSLAAGKEEFIAVGNLYGVRLNSPLTQLCASLYRHPHSRFFRVTWDSSGTIGSDCAVVLYDRVASTLKLAHKDLEHDDTNPKFSRLTATDRHWTFTNVTDAKLLRLARTIKAPTFEPGGESDDAALGYFPRLRFLGCRKKLVKHFWKTWHEKY